MLYRITRGNGFVRFQQIEQPIEDPVTGESVQKVVFMVVLLGRELVSRVGKVVATYQGTVFETPKDRNSFETVLTQLRQDLIDKRAVLGQTKSQIFNLLSSAARYGGTSPLRDWQVKLHKHKAINDALMKCHFIQEGKIIVAEGWCPAIHLPYLRERVQAAVAGKGIPPASVSIDPANPIKQPGSPPTYFPTNKFTSTFQGIVDTYGTPRYQEANPGLFTIVTFPFLFGVMYGDIGHGTMLFIAALLMILNEKKLEKKMKDGTLGEIPTMAFSGRYVIILMGFFGLYCGTIYNDCMSIPLNIYGSTFDWNNGTQSFIHNGYAYPYGIDPRWTHSVNHLAFMNSFKMKVAVTLGVLQMLFGVFLSLSNHIHFRDSASIWYEFFPRLLFLLCTFGYMIFMIIFKLCIDWSVPGRNPPNLIQTMIAMFLNPGSVASDKQLYQGQAIVQAILVLIAFAAVPMMLLPKPFINRAKHRRALAQAGHDVSHEHTPDGSTDNLHGGHWQPDHHDTGLGLEHKGHEEKKELIKKADDHSGGGHGHGDGEYSFGDDMIHQSIHTIEYVLGTVSNTASYLRLWALSLAHSELAAVFWDKMLSQYGYENGAVFTFVGFAIWLFATVGVLLAMDVLECFLHALRLHWVEFQNKFYNADGYPFDPFTFERYGQGFN
jgi:V-type H+-transporting ATPase subunit a